jgi:ABC-type transport system substrate-binding protein
VSAKPGAAQGVKPLPDPARRRWLQAAAGAASAAGIAPRAARAEAEPGVLRIAMNIIESGFDPLQVSDETSVKICAHVFEAPLAYDPFAVPVKIVPWTAAALPEASADFRHFVFTIRPGILFTDHPAFGGRPRELTAADYVYSIKRYYDPALRTENLYQFENLKLLGLSELRREALRTKTPFPYDVVVPGLRALDRHRFELRCADPAPRLPHLFAMSALTAALAREVCEAHGVDVMAHPVGTGPFRLADWRRGSRIVLERNPRWRGWRWDGAAPEGDAEAMAAAAAVRGRALPLLRRVEVAPIEEAQPRWLAFVNGEHDVLRLPPAFGELAVPGGTLAPFLAQRGVRMHRRVIPAVQHTFFNHDDAVLGGYTPDRVALRRAIALAWDGAVEARVIDRGQAVPAMGMIPPGCRGHDPALLSERGRPSLARAAALLDVAGYARDPRRANLRHRPDGQPLVVKMAFASGAQRSRQESELWQKRLASIGVRFEAEFGTFGELIKRALAGQLPAWGFQWVAGQPDGDFFLGLAYGPNTDQSNDARFRLPAYDRAYERQRALPDGPERDAAMAHAHRLMLAWMPYIPRFHPVETDLRHAHVRAYRRHEFARGDWLWADVGAPPARG